MTHTTVRVRPFGTVDGASIALWTIENGDRSISVSVSEWGATIQSVRAPDRHGHIDEIALGFPTLEGYRSDEYLRRTPFFGGTIGRFANRIARGRFVLDGVEHVIPANDGANALHGGPRGFDQRRWTSTPLDDGVSMTRFSRSGEEGFPGDLEITVDFRLTEDRFRVEYRARAAERTVANFTNHTYWNLAGEGSGPATDHLLQVHADSYLPVDESLIPLGTLEPVARSPFDFRSPTRIVDRLELDHLQLVRAGGIDHTLVLRPPESGALRVAMSLLDPSSGRLLQISTSEPGLQVYTGNFLDGTFSGHSGQAYIARSGLAFEPQHFPDSPNRPSFPSTVVAPGRALLSITEYRLSVAD